MVERLARMLDAGVRGRSPTAASRSPAGPLPDIAARVERARVRARRPACRDRPDGRLRLARRGESRPRAGDPAGAAGGPGGGPAAGGDRTARRPGAGPGARGALGAARRGPGGRPRGARAGRAGRIVRGSTSPSPRGWSWWMGSGAAAERGAARRGAGRAARRAAPLRRVEHAADAPARGRSPRASARADAAPARRSRGHRAARSTTSPTCRARSATRELAVERVADGRARVRGLRPRHAPPEPRCCPSTSARAWTS